MKLDKIRVILVEPSHPGNIGSAARAMKIMGISQLVLVKPKQFPDPKAYELASRADDILEKAFIVESLDEALIGSSLTFGMSARARVMSQSVVTPREAAVKIIGEYDQHPFIALVFGRENSGLKNHELERCPFQVRIPAIDQYSSLNLAAAVQVIVYEIFIASLDEKRLAQAEVPSYASDEEIEGLLNHFERALTEINFFNPSNPRRMLPRIRQILNRARLDKEDVNLFRGMLVAIENSHNGVKK